MNFGFQDSSSMFDSVPDIGGYQADFVNVNNILNNKAKSADWGAATGAGVGSFFGAPQEGANIGRAVFPLIEKGFNSIFGK